MLLDVFSEAEVIYIVVVVLSAVLSFVIMYQIIKYAVYAGIKNVIGERKTELWKKGIKAKTQLAKGEISQEEYDNNITKLTNSIVNRW